MTVVEGICYLYSQHRHVSSASQRKKEVGESQVDIWWKDLPGKRLAGKKAQPWEELACLRSSMEAFVIHVW